MAPPPKLPPFDPGRRRFLTGVAGAAGALALPGCGTGSGAPEAAALATLPDPASCGIDHIVQVMMENRSFDHFLGWVPGADGVQNRTFLNSVGSDISTFHLASDPAYGYQGCGWADPNHSYAAGRVHYNNGAMDGWLQTAGTSDNPEDRFPVGYYGKEDLKFYAGAAENFTVCDRYFHGILASTFPNRIYMHAGATDRMDNSFYPPGTPAPATIPTIWDELAAKGISGKNYFSDAPITAFWGEKYGSISAPFSQFLADAQAGQLPQVSYFDPNFGGGGAGESPSGVSRDDHPQADVRDGQVYLTQIYNALRASPNWDKTLMIVTYDEWGGFFDHVAPDISPVSQAETDLGNDGRLGFRTPCVILGPRARRGHVSHIPFDPNSVINLIRWRFGLGPIGASPRNQSSLNMALALDFDNPPTLAAPDFGDLGPDGLGNSAGTPWGSQCNAPVPAGNFAQHQSEWQGLAEMARRYKLIR